MPHVQKNGESEIFLIQHQSHVGKRTSIPSRFEPGLRASLGVRSESSGPEVIQADAMRAASFWVSPSSIRHGNSGLPLFLGPLRVRVPLGFPVAVVPRSTPTGPRPASEAVFNRLDVGFHHVAGELHAAFNAR